MSRYPRWMRLEQRAQDLAKIERIIATVGGDSPEPVRAKTEKRRNTPADANVMRMIPITAEGVAGTVPGTNPLAELIDKEGRMERRGLSVRTSWLTT